MALTDKDSIFLHCLPSFHDTNTTIGKDVAGSSRRWRPRTRSSRALSKVFDEAENRMHTIKAVMYAIRSPARCWSPAPRAKAAGWLLDSRMCLRHGI